MSERKKTPDLLGLVMSGNDSHEHKEIKQEKSKAIKNENDKTVNTSNNRSVKQESSKEIKQENDKDVNISSNNGVWQESNKEINHDDDELKEKATFNLSKQILIELEDEWMNIRRAFGGNKRITKTLIVEVALEMALEDFKHREQNGKLYCKLADHKALKQ